MADIQKCVGTGCPLRERCYRYTAPSSDFNQSYLITVPFKEGGLITTCSYYLIDYKKDNRNIFKTLNPK